MTDYNDILIVSDSEGICRVMSGILNSNFGNVFSSFDQSSVLSLFNSHKIALLIFAFQDTDAAAHFYLSIYQNSDFSEVPHYQTLLVCNKDETRKSYELCTRDIFDDYVVNEPTKGSYRLVLSVKHALENYIQKTNLNSLKLEMVKINTGLKVFDEIISGQIQSGSAIHQRAIEAFQQFSESLVTDFEGLEEKVLSNYLNSDDNSKANINETIKKFRESVLKQRVPDVSDELNSTKDWLSQLNIEYGENFKTLKPKTSDNVRIILVDDDDFYRDTILSMFEEEKRFKIDDVNSGFKALQEIERNKPDLILLDYNMPDLNGIDTLKKLKSNSNTSDIPVIMITGIGERKLVNECMLAGAIDFIVKPSDYVTILDKIKSVIPM